MKKHVLAAVLFFAAAVAPAAAYTSYVKPGQFWITEPAIYIEGAFATEFFTPAIAIGERVTITNSAGQTVSPGRLAVTATATQIDARLMSGGTYRISTGEVAGQVANLVGENGQWRVLGQGEIPAEGAPTTTLQTITVADAYVTRGTASRENVDRTIGRLAIRPITHPNQVLAAQGFEVEVLFDGAPMANTAVVLYAAGDLDTKVDRFVVTNDAGRAVFTFDAPGPYVIAARHRADMPPGAPAAVGSYTTTLTFEALDALYPEVEIRAPGEDEPRRRRRR
jgi:hypothetical protein